MEFKSLFYGIEVQKVKQEPSILHISDDFEITEIELFDDGFLCFRIERNQNASKYGVESKNNSGDHVPLKKELNKRDIFLQDFIIIDQEKKDIYYTGSKASAEDVVSEYLKLSKEYLGTRVSLENLAVITEIKVVEYPCGQISAFTHGNEFQVSNDISSIFCNPNPYEKIERIYKMRKGSFYKDNLIELVNKHKSDHLRKYTIEGKDENGNFMKYSDGAFARKYDILTDDCYKDYALRAITTLREIKDELKKVVK